MRRQGQPTPLSRFLGIALLTGAGFWLSFYPKWALWGLGLMGLGLILLIKFLYGFVGKSLHTAHQINLLHESRIISGGYGQARLATIFDPFIKDMIRNTHGLFVGMLEGKKLYYDPYQSGNGHMLTYAPSRTGKTVSLVVPALLHWFGGSVVVTDVKGELLRLTAWFRRLCRQTVLILDPFGETDFESLNFNPLRVLVDDILKNSGQELHTLARLIAIQLIPEKSSELGDGVFFRNGGRRLIVTFLLYLAVFEPKHCHLPGLRQCIWASDERKFVIAMKMKDCRLFGGLLKDYGNALADVLAPEYIKTYGAFRDNAMNALEIFETHSDFGKSLLNSDFALYDVLNGKTTLYMILPESKLETHGPWMGLIVTLLVETVALSKKPSRLLMILEEMGQIGRLPNIAKALSLLPGKGVRAMMIFQSRRQPLEIYGQNTAGLIEEQSSLVQAWSIRSEHDRKAWSVRIGNKTLKGRTLARDPEAVPAPWRLNVFERAHPVLSPDEIGRLGGDEQLIAIDGKPVIRAKKHPYFEDRVWVSRTKAQKRSKKSRSAPDDRNGQETPS